MKSRLIVLSTLALASLSPGCAFMTPFQRPAPSCQVISPDSSKMQECPERMAPPLSDATGASLLLGHQQDRAAYDLCREQNKAKLDYINDLVKRCITDVKKS